MPSCGRLRTGVVDAFPLLHWSTTSQCIHVHDDALLFEVHGLRINLDFGVTGTFSQILHTKNTRMSDAYKRRRLQSQRIEAMDHIEGRALLDIEEQLGPVMKWPSRFTEMMLSAHLRFPERWQLTLFLLGNRCPPKLMTEWYIKRRMLSDKSARDQVIDLIQKHKSGKLEEEGRTTFIMGQTITKPVWDRAHKWDGVGDPCDNLQGVISTPTFAHDFQHEWYWTQAIELLKSSNHNVPPQNFKRARSQGETSFRPITN